MSNRNIDVLARICNAKADQEDMKHLMDEFHGAAEGDAMSLAAGRIHFRLVACERGGG